MRAVGSLNFDFRNTFANHSKKTTIVNGEGEASGACADGAYIDGACADGACASIACCCCNC